MPGISRAMLHQFGSEQVWLIRMHPNAIWPRHLTIGGEEILVVEGSCHDEAGHLPARAWLRLPDGSEHQLSTSEGCLLYVKTGHLPRRARALAHG